MEKGIMSKNEILELLKGDVKACEEMSDKLFKENSRSIYWDGKANGLRSAIHLLELYIQENIEEV